MEAPANEAKYVKLASEYSKLRAQASVLKKAVLDEQGKSSSLRDQLRQRETALRRSEQEVDSLGFRNRQLEQRVAALQDDIATREGRQKRQKDHKRERSGKTNETQQVGGHDFANEGGSGDIAQDAIIFEELQKKIMENAQLTSLVDDKERQLLLHSEHISNLEQSMEKRSNEQGELEKRLRRELESLQCRNTELETKLVEAASMLGSEDALSVSGSDTTPSHSTVHQNSHGAPLYASMGNVHTNEDRIACLEKEVAHWRTQYEIAKMNETFACNSKENSKHQQQQQQSIVNALPGGMCGMVAIANDLPNHCSCSSTAAGITVKPSAVESKSSQRARDSLKEPPIPPSKEQLIYNNFCNKFEDLLKSKCMAESRVSSYETEVEHLQICLENATQELKAKDEQMQSLSQALQVLEEDLATTRINYEEQISVLTEQVISLSEQLASCK